MVCAIVPESGWKFGTKTLQWPTLAEVLMIESDNSEILMDSTWLTMVDSTWLSVIDTTEIVSDTESVEKLTCLEDTTDAENSVLPKEKPVHIPHVILDEGIDAHMYLQAFYQALDSVQEKTVRVVHYGDSQIEEDRMTSMLRERWQHKYGGGGVGLIPLHQTIPTRSIRQWMSMDGHLQTTQGGPKRYLIYGPRTMRQESDDYGVMGQVAVMDNTVLQGSEDIRLTIEPFSNKHMAHNYFNRVRLLTDSVEGFCQVKGSEEQYALLPNELIEIPDSTVQCKIHLQGKGRVYGLSLETTVGIIVDNIPMRGSSGSFFTKIDSASLSDFYRETNTRLIILQFGGNMIPHTKNPSTLNGYVKTLQNQVRYLRQCAPQAAILFVGLSDMSTRVDGKLTTYPLLPYLDKRLALMAQEEKIAYWSLYNAMGGFESMLTWHSRGLAGSDYVHFTRSGANIAGRMLGKWIDEGKEIMGKANDSKITEQVINNDSVK